MSVYSSYSDWLTALGGTYTRASNASYYNSSGTLSTASTNALRFDYDPVTHAPKGILLEGARTNLATYSRTLQGWSGNLQVSLNQATAPDGTGGATKISQAAAGGGSLYQSILVQPSITAGTYTRSFFAKKAEMSWIYIQQYDGTTNYGVYFDLDTGTVGTAIGSCTGKIEPVGNGWYRCQVTNTTAGGATVERAQIAIVSGDGASPSYTGDGVSGVYVDGAQLEAGAFASSYIPTTSASATRAVDILTFPTRPWFNSSAGTLFAEISLLAAQSGYPRLVCIHDGTSNNYIAFANINSLTSQQFEVYVGGVAQATIARAITGTADKYISAFATNDFAHATNGTLGTPDASGSVPAVTSFNAIAVPSGSAGFVWIRKIGYWPFRVTNAELQRLTT